MSNFKDHQLTVTKIEAINSTEYKWKRPGDGYNMIKLLVGNGRTIVTGDFGDWIFWREFTPDSFAKVDIGYFAGKCSAVSTNTSGIKCFCDDKKNSQLEDCLKEWMDENEDISLPEEIERIKDAVNQLKVMGTEYDVNRAVEELDPEIFEALFGDYYGVPDGKVYSPWLRTIWESLKSMKVWQEKNEI